MKVNVVSLSSDKKSSQELNDEIYGLDPRSDILHRVVTWQLAKRRSGTHKTKERGEIKGSTKKIMNQKSNCYKTRKKYHHTFTFNDPFTLYYETNHYIT